MYGVVGVQEAVDYGLIDAGAHLIPWPKVARLCANVIGKSLMLVTQCSNTQIYR